MKCEGGEQFSTDDNNNDNDDGGDDDDFQLPRCNLSCFSAGLYVGNGVQGVWYGKS